jgi:hypothetical protein
MLIQELGLGWHELEKEIFPRVAASKPTDQNTKPKDDVPTSFNRSIRYANKVIVKSKKIMWVPKRSTPIKVELIRACTTLTLELSLGG